MKKNYWMAGALVCALAAATTGCNNEELDGKTPADKGQRATITASMPQEGAGTRVSYDETTDASKVMPEWDIFDAIGVWKAGENTVNEFIADFNGISIFFTSTNPVSFSADDQLYAVYPQPSAVAGNVVTLDLSAAQSGAMDDAYHYMYAAAQWQEDNNTAHFNFRHAVSILKLRLNFSGINASNLAWLTGVTLSATGLHNKATLTMGATPTVSGTDAGDITAGGSLNVANPICLYIFPEALSGIKITATDGAKTYEGTLTDKTTVAGKVYTAEVTMTEQMPNITWATGNLIADGHGGAKIGAPTDGGILFQFGSLIGWNGTANEDGTGTGNNGLGFSIPVQPANFNGSYEWMDTGKIWQGKTGTVPFTVAGSGSADEKAGIGDPCRYYLKGTWRLPTMDEFEAFFSDKDYPDGSWKWDDASKSATNSILNLTFPASGYRNSIGVGEVGSSGCYWSATPYSDNNSHFLDFSDSSMNPRIVGSRNRGYPVRCVQDKK